MILCFKYVITAALNNESIGKHLERISKIRSLIVPYDWTDKNFPTGSKKLENFLNKPQNNHSQCFFYQTVVMV